MVEEILCGAQAMPTMAQAGDYRTTLHYLKAIKAAGTDDPKAVNAAMRKMPIEDLWSDEVRTREDGRVMGEMLLFKVKKAKDSKARGITTISSGG